MANGETKFTLDKDAKIHPGSLALIKGALDHLQTQKRAPMHPIHAPSIISLEQAKGLKGLVDALSLPEHHARHAIGLTGPETFQSGLQDILSLIDTTGGPSGDRYTDAQRQLQTGGYDLGDIGDPSTPEGKIDVESMVDTFSEIADTDAFGGYGGGGGDAGAVDDAGDAVAGAEEMGGEDM